jgi:glutathione S-transferase
MPMHLYHHPQSSCSRRVVMTILELGLADRVELVKIDLGKGGQRAPEYLRINPNGRVPALVDEGFVLWESHAIMQYLADGTPGQTLYPIVRQARADVNRWLFWNANHFGPAIGILNRENWAKRLIGQGDPDPKEVARGEELFTVCARVLDAHLGTKEWIAQGQLTLADLAIASELSTAMPAKLPMSGFASLHAWLGRVQLLDAWKKTNV